MRGSITGADGKSDLLIPRDRATYVRAWDPKLNYFANSILTIEAGSAVSSIALLVLLLAGTTTSWGVLVGGGLLVGVMPLAEVIALNLTRQPKMGSFSANLGPAPLWEKPPSFADRLSTGSLQPSHASTFVMLPALAF